MKRQCLISACTAICFIIGYGFSLYSFYELGQMKVYEKTTKDIQELNDSTLELYKKLFE